MSARPGPDRQGAVYLDGVAGRPPRVPVHPEALEAAARSRLSPDAWAYIGGGAGVGRTMNHNREAFSAWRFRPRMLAGVAERDWSVEVFGRRWAAPLMLCPIGVLDMARRDGDRLAARAAAAEGWPVVFSNQADAPMERVAAAMDAVRPGAERWFQLYWSRSRELAASFVARAEACGCSALVVTLDTTLLGWRTRDLDRAWLPFLRGMGMAQYTSDPVFGRLVDDPAAAAPWLEGPEPPRRVTANALGVLWRQCRRVPGGFWANLRSGRATRAVKLFTRIYSNPGLHWEDLAWLRARTRLPIVLKGILDPADARRALDAGVDGLWISNHGGRQVDLGVGALAALPAVRDAVAGRLPLFFDSGVRGGADAALALALGATAVGLGRPWVYGLALAGEDGVREVLANTLAELDLQLGLCGCRTMADVTPERLVPAGSA